MTLKRKSGHLLENVSEFQAAKSTDVYYSWTVVILF